MDINPKLQLSSICTRPSLMEINYYYFATDHYFYVVKDHDNFGLVYHRTKNLRSDTNAEMLTVSPSIASSMRRHLNEIEQPALERGM